MLKNNPYSREGEIVAIPLFLADSPKAKPKKKITTNNLLLQEPFVKKQERYSLRYSNKQEVLILLWRLLLIMES